jgi:3-hydroxy-5-methyl-1-naphthoate 3-O-methyltransferase
MSNGFMVSSILLTAMEILLFNQDEEACTIAREEIARENLHNHIELTRKDFYQDEIGSNYDLILLSSILRLFGEKEYIFLLNKVKDALRDRGRVVIFDLILDESKKPLLSATFYTNMLAMTLNGRAYPSSDVKARLSSLRFQNIQRIPLGNAQTVKGGK